VCGPSRVGKTTLIKKLLLSESLELRSRFGITGPCVKAHGLSRGERAEDIGRVQADQFLIQWQANFTIASRVCRTTARTAATASSCFHCPQRPEGAAPEAKSALGYFRGKRSQRIGMSQDARLRNRPNALSH
jgi:hypothetical protein